MPRASSADVVSATTDLCCLPPELLQFIFTQYCDASMFENLWYAASSSDKGCVNQFWQLLNQVVDLRIKRRSSTSCCGDQDLPRLASTALVRSDFNDPHRTFRQRLIVLKYSEQLPGVIWCGYVEFKDPMMPEWSAQTARVVLRCDEAKNSWNWTHAVAWNQCFSQATVKLVSQMYNFVPVRPRGQLFGVTTEDQAILAGVSRKLHSRDQVMTLRFGNTDGFILRVVSPAQAHQRLGRLFGGSGGEISRPMTQALKTSPEALVCSWECQYDGPDTVTDSDKLHVINSMVQSVEGMT